VMDYFYTIEQQFLIVLFCSLGVIHWLTGMFVFMERNSKRGR
jgi:hypothetical protein